MIAPKINCRLIVVVATALAASACSSSGTGTGAGPVSGNTPAHTVQQPWAAILPAQAQRLADSGDPSAVQIVRSTTKPFEGCDRPNVFGWTTATGRALAADELAWFFAHIPPDPGCPAYLYLFRTADETHRSGFNAGAVIYDDHLMDVDVGSPLDGPMYEFKAL